VVAATVRRTLIVLGAGLLVGVLPGGAARAAPTPSPGPVATIVVRFPAGPGLPPGTYQVTVRVSDRPVTGVGAVPPASPSADSSSPSTWELWLGLLVVLFGGALAAGAVLAGRGPARRRREFVRLAGLIDRGEYEDATAGLTLIEGRLPAAQRAQARFYIAFALYQRGEMDEAEHRLAAMHREDRDDDEVAYLLAYLRVQRRDFDGAEPVLAALAGRGRLGVGEARRLYGIVTFQRATRALADGRIAEAAELFERVEQLGDFRDEVPTDLRNRHAVLGARALIDGDLPAARAQFEQLEGAARADDLRVSALLGLALTGWREAEPGGAPRVHKHVTECLRLLDPQGPRALPWPRPPSDDVADRLRAARASGEVPADELDRRATLRDLNLMRALALLRAVSEAERPAAADRLLAGVAQVLACVVRLDPTIADPYLLVGLLRYRLAAGGADTRLAVEELRAARMLGARDPMLLQILHRHDREDESRRTQWRRFAAAGTLAESRFGRVPTMDDSPDAVPVSRNTPLTVAELRDRADLLAARLRGLDAGPEAAGLAARLDEGSSGLDAQLRAFERAEADALARYGDRLLTALDGAAPDGAAPDGAAPDGAAPDGAGEAES
jgi:hypothetical protein